jgi:hypothetical protein
MKLSNLEKEEPQICVAQLSPRDLLAVYRGESQPSLMGSSAGAFCLDRASARMRMLLRTRERIRRYLSPNGVIRARRTLIGSECNSWEKSAGDAGTPSPTVGAPWGFRSDIS